MLMKPPVRFAILVCLLTAACGCTISQWTRSGKLVDEKGNVIDARSIIIEAPDSRLPESETLTYEVRWLGMSVGTMTASVKGVQEVNGRKAYVLEAVVKTSPFFSGIYSINDRFVSYLDVEKLHTLRHEVYRRDGKYKKDAVTEFDQENHTAHFRNLLDKSEKSFPIPPGVQDTLSACYYFMLLPIKVGDRIEYQVCNNEANYRLLSLIESKAFISLPGIGEKQAFLIQPYATLKDKKVDKGRVKAYFTAEKRRIPLVAVIRGPVFSEVTVTLRKVERKEAAPQEAVPQAAPQELKPPEAAPEPALPLETKPPETAPGEENKLLETEKKS